MSRIVRRLIFSFSALIGIVSFSFVLVHFVPGDPVDLILGEQASSVDQLELRKQLGFDRPLWKQYLHYVTQALKFDLGQSIYDQQSVMVHVRNAFWPTLFLTLSSLFLSILWGIPLGVLSVVYRNSFLDRLGSLVSVCGFSLPVFFSAPLLIWVFSIYWPIFPVSGQEGFIYYVLPSVSLALPLGSALCQMSRSSLLEIIQKDYIRTARAKGLRKRKIYFKHAFKPVLVPIITILSLQFAALLSGVIIVETIFDWPGLGLLLFQSISRRDYPVIQACVLVIAVIYLVVNVLADFAYALVHPQMRD
ncbi:MAG: ABC transporter permease [Bdellovibrionales bacterium]|nr:ABC transporter permease [Bdellovibrionales bacterium]